MINSSQFQEKQQLALIYNIQMQHRTSMDQQRQEKCAQQGQITVQPKQAQLSKEKQQSMLLDQYRRAMYLLKGKQTAQGSELLKKILFRISQLNKNQTASDKTLQQLYQSCLISLSELYSQQGQIHIALQLLYEVASARNEFNLWMKMANICQKNSLYDQAEFTLKKAFRVTPYIWKERVLQKLLQIYRKNNKHEAFAQLQELMGSPFQIQQILAQQKQTVRDKKRQSFSLNKQRNAVDRNQKDRKSLQKQFKREQNESFVQKISFKVCKAALSITKSEFLKVKDLQITLYRNKNQHKWEFILSLIYVLIKAKSQRNFTGKKYLSKYEKDLRQFAQTFSPIYSSISINLKQIIGGIQASGKQENASQNGSHSNKQSFQSKQPQSKISLQKMQRQSNQSNAKQRVFDIKNVVKDFLFHQKPFDKKKKHKKKDQNELMLENKQVMPLQPISNKKNAAINYRTNFVTLGAYIREINNKNDFSIQQLTKLQILFSKSYNQDSVQRNQEIEIEMGNCNSLNSTIFDKVFGQVMIDPMKELEQNMNKQKQRQQKQLKQKQERQNDKATTKQKVQTYFQIHNKYLQTSFCELFETPKQKLDQKNQTEQKYETKKYKNVFQLASDVIHYILKQSLDASSLNGLNRLPIPSMQKNIILDSSIIRTLTKKVIVKLIQNSQRYLDLILSDTSWQGIIAKTTLLQLLSQKIDQVSAKNFKNKEFKNYQSTKLSHIKTFITQKLEPQTFLLIPQVAQKQSPQSCTVEFLGVMARRFRSLIILYSSLDSYSQKDTQKCLAHYLYYARKITEAMPKDQTWSEKKFQIGNKQNQQKHKPIQLLLHPNQIPLNQNEIRNFVQERLKKVQKTVASDIQKQNIDQDEQRIQNIQEILKNDGENGQSMQRILSLRQILTNEICSDVSANVYLRCLIEMVSLFFRKVKLKAPLILANKRYQFNSKTITPWAQFLKLQPAMQIAQKQLSKLLAKQDDKIQFQQGLSQQLIVETIYLLIKLYLIQPFDNKSPGLLNCFKSILELANYQLKHNLPTQKIGDIAVTVTLLLQSLVSTKKKSEKEVFTQFNRRLYFNFMSKHIKQIYNSVSFGQNQVTREKILTILQSIYYDREKPFSPKKFEDAIGYFIYMSKAHSKSFECKQIDLSSKVTKMFRKCYRIFADNCRTFYPYCEKFEDFYYNFMDMITNIKLSKTSFLDEYEEQFIKVCQGSQTICQCCRYKETDPDYLDALYIIGKYFETQHNPSLNQQDGRRKAESKISKEVRQEIQHNDDDNIGEKTYLELLLLDFKSSSNWENLIRVNCIKAYEFFDHFTSPVDYKNLQIDGEHHFKDSYSDVKKISAFIKAFLNDKINGALQSINILNAIKIAERQYQVRLAESLEQWDNSAFLSQKYHYGLYKVLQKFKTEDVRIKFIQLIQLKFPQTLHRLRIEIGSRRSGIPISNEHKSDFKQELGVVMAEVLDLCRKYKTQDIHAEYNVKHLEQDLIIQFYILVLEAVQIYITRTIVKNNSILEILEQTCGVIEIVQNNQFQNGLSDSYRINSLVAQNQGQVPVKKAQIQQRNDQQKQILSQSHKDLEQQYLNKKQQFESELEVQANQSQIDDDQQNLEKRQSKRSIPKKLGQKQNSKQSNAKQAFQLGLPENIIMDFLRNQLDIDASYPQLQQKSKKIDLFLKNILKILQKTPQLQTKRYRFRRSVINAMIWSSRTYLFYTGNYQRANYKLKNYYNLKTDDIVFVYHHYERISTEKNQLLAEYFNRSLVYMNKKIQFLVHLIRMFSMRDIQNLIGILKKLLKISIIQSSVSQKQFKVQRSYFFVFLYGLSLLLNCFKKQASLKRIDQRYQRMLSEWKNRIKKAISVLSYVDSSQDYQNLRAIQKLESFTVEYEQKYNIKMRIKRKKQTQVLNEVKPSQNIIKEIVSRIKQGQSLSQKFKSNKISSIKKDTKQQTIKGVKAQAASDSLLILQKQFSDQQMVQRLNILGRQNFLLIQIIEQQNIIKSIKKQKGYPWNQDNQVQIQQQLQKKQAIAQQQEPAIAHKSLERQTKRGRKKIADQIKYLGEQ